MHDRCGGHERCVSHGRCGLNPRIEPTGSAHISFFFSIPNRTVPIHYSHKPTPLCPILQFSPNQSRPEHNPHQKLGNGCGRYKFHQNCVFSFGALPNTLCRQGMFETTGGWLILVFARYVGRMIHGDTR
jgi:hypothetical protein